MLFEALQTFGFVDALLLVALLVLGYLWLKGLMGEEPK